MKIHEYQAKAIFRREGLDVPRGEVFDQKTLSVASIERLGSVPLVVKAQVHAGGRGKAGGIQMVQNAQEAYEAAQKLLGRRLITYQSGGSGQPIERVLIEEASLLKRELYFAAAVDRERALPCVIFSEAGGMEIEEVARKHPEQIRKLYFNPRRPLSAADAESGLAALSVAEAQRLAIVNIVSALSRLLVKIDASLIEINPLGILGNGEVRIVDAKIVLDDNALYRHPDIAALRDTAQEDSREVEAKEQGLSYVGLEGNIGCMVNGAGLAMATMDIIKYFGGEPANFLDVGGGASVEQVKAAFKILLSDRQVRAVLVNIFGGIMKCDVVADGVLKAVREVALGVPLVIRLEGTRVEEGMKLLSESGLPFILAKDFEDGAQKAVAAALSEVSSRPGKAV